ncbi:anti-phage dCTP deaminase [Acidicapsa dinghuensis]|uniref:Anti-phage dCTP deaminase n=1 Tax=Acidicapsa dinghuensis TaxID=2218256 RepID=A0ABW1EBG8_9BACT|nr:anti-phage dCTP deaminase [Acidicapsa dinghuensis]
MAPIKPVQVVGPIEPFEFCESELVIGFTYAVGTNYRPVQEFIIEILKQYHYKPNVIRVSDLIGNLSRLDLDDKSEVGRVSTLMDAGNSLCRTSGHRDIWALASIVEINKKRGSNAADQKPLERTAHLIFSLKRPEEVSTLRKVYAAGFFVIGVFATETERLEYLIDGNAPKISARELIKRDEDELADDDGQKTSKTFQLADVFVQLKNQAYRAELSRFFSLIFSDPYQTPTQHEQAMFLAYASSLRSGQLGRQVGAVITSKTGDVLAVGCNDVPKPGGGLYWPGQDDNRDHVLGEDTNDKRKAQIIDQLISKLPENLEESLAVALRKSFREVLDITEYGRAVHAEMDALLTCARSGVSPQGALLYTTTFPCHNCARHIIAAGIERVIYIEPYAKSKAQELHEDAIVVEEKAEKSARGPKRKLPFTHFVGIGPRRYFDLFSLNQSTGHELERKENGKKFNIQTVKSWPRIPLSPYTYMERERMAIEVLSSIPKQLDMFEPEE